MPAELSITLRYSGADVDDGTMSLDEVVDALQGFSGSYSKIASLRSTATEHQLKVAGVRTGSFDMLIQAWSVVQQVAPTIEKLHQAGESAMWVVKRIAGVIGRRVKS